MFGDKLDGGQSFMPLANSPGIGSHSLPHGYSIFKGPGDKVPKMIRVELWPIIRSMFKDLWQAHLMTMQH